MLIEAAALNLVERFQLANRWIWKLIAGLERLFPTVDNAFPPHNWHKGGLKFADVGTKVIPSMLTAVLGVVKEKQRLEVSGHQRVMHGSRPRHGSSQWSRSEPDVQARVQQRTWRVCVQIRLHCLVFLPSWPKDPTDHVQCFVKVLSKDQPSSTWILKTGSSFSRSIWCTSFLPTRSWWIWHHTTLLLNGNKVLKCRIL